MSIDNKTAATRMIWIIISAIIISMLCLLICILFRIDALPVYIVIVPFLTVLIFRLVTLKYFKLDISDELISIKYHHPLIKHYKSANLELPWDKVYFCQLNKSIVSHYICIGVTGKKRDKMFYYDLGILSKSSIRIIQNHINNGILNLNKNSINEQKRA